MVLSRAIENYSPYDRGCYVRSVPKNHDLELRHRLRAWVRFFMEDRGLTQTALAERIGAKQPTINGLYNATGSLGLDTVVRLHRGMHVSLDTLVNEDPPTPKSVTNPRKPSPPISEAREGGGAAEGESSVRRKTL